jgi:cystathionine beta-synthase
MMRNPTFYQNVLETVGQTPLVRLNRVVAGATEGTVLAKVESFNPGGSVKDRVGLAIVEDAERRGLIRPGGTIVESTSGNTGMGLALAAIIKGYRCVFVMPDKMSDEKVRLLRALGARVVITPTAVPPDDPRSYYSVARRIVDETPNAILANQYHNPANPQAHYATTGPELWEQTAGQIAVLVVGMGTGGTITGTGRYLKDRNPDVRVVGVDIQGSLLYETWKEGRLPAEPHPKTYKIEGIGEDFLPTTLDLSVVDEVVQVDDRESFQMTRRLVREEGLFCGGSSGSAVAGLLKSKFVRGLRPGQVAVALLPDSGDRYLSKIFDDNWMRENGFLAADRSTETVASLLAHREEMPLISAGPDERVTSVVEKMKKYDISQLPVVGADRKLIGVISEADVLDHLLHADHVHDPEETIGPLVNPNIITVSRETSIQNVSTAFEQGKVAAVTEDGRLVGMLTKIDLIDYLYGKVEE